MSTTILDFYEDEEAFEQTLDDADIRAVTEKEMSFVTDMRNNFEQYGRKTFISEAQHEWLERISGGR